MTLALEQPDVGLFANSRTVSQQEVLDKHDAWVGGETVLSTMEAVGRIALGIDTLTLLHSVRLRRTPYKMLQKSSPLLAGMEEVTEALSAIAEADRERCGLEGTFWSSVLAGNYTRINREVWHSDNYKLPS